MDRTERLLDLVALLLDSREPISWAELREAFPEDYGSGSDEAAERKFERDKAELLELGIPIRYIQGDDDRKDGYMVEPESYYLPEVGLTPEELAVLYAAGSAALASGAFPGRDDLAHALRKIRFLEGQELPVPKVRMELAGSQLGPELASWLEQLWSAAAAHKWVQLTYYSPHDDQETERRVDPYGLALRQGTWWLVGYCHLRQDLRTFRVNRIREIKVNPSRPRTADFEVPADFKLQDHVASYVWQHRFESPLEVQLVLTGARASLAAHAFPDAQVERQGDRVRVTLTCTFLDGLIRYALSLGADCKVVSPPSAVARYRELAGKVLAAHHPLPLARAGGAS
jgi:proteasome accessory factor B